LLKNQFASFQVTELPLTDPVQAAAVLALLAKDERELKGKTVSPESKVVYQEILQRQKTLNQAWAKMEHDRWHGQLSSPTYPIGDQSIEALKDYLGFIDQDLAVLAAAESNSVTQEIQKKLLENKKRAQNQIFKFEKKAEKARQQANPPQQGTGCLAAILASLASLGAGLAALFSNESKRPPASDRGPTDSSSPAEATTDIGSSVVSHPSSAEMPSWQIGGIGCLLALLTMGCIAFLGTALLMNIFPKPSQSNGAFEGGVFLLSTLAIVLGEWVFFHFAAPYTVIRGIGRLPTIRFAPGKAKKGLKNLLLIRGLVGVSACITCWSLFTSIAGFMTFPDSPLPSIIIAIGFFLGLALSVFIAYHTEIE
jgi:hypothetical protein